MMVRLGLALLALALSLGAGSGAATAAKPPQPGGDTVGAATRSGAAGSPQDARRSARARHRSGRRSGQATSGQAPFTDDPSGKLPSTSGSRGGLKVSTRRRDRHKIDYSSPGVSPPGANDFDCKPTKAHLFPVVLVHGTFGDMTVSWNELSPELKAQGYCVFALDYGERATNNIRRSAAQLRDFVHRVLRATGARKVSLVGHSQGGMMPRYYIRFLGGRDEVSDLVGLSPSNHGTTNPLAAGASQYGDCRACKQQIAGSHFIRQLNAGGAETFAGIDYTVIETRYDEVVTPFRSEFLDGPRSRVTNVLLQDRCPNDTTDHVGIIYDPVALQWVENALGRNGPADPKFHPVCL